jgi:hypothetical protein
MRPNSGIPLSEWSGSGATRELHATIQTFNERATEQTAEMVRLTRTVTRLTWAMIGLVVVQIVVGIAAIIAAA